MLVDQISNCAWRCLKNCITSVLYAETLTLLWCDSLSHTVSKSLFLHHILYTSVDVCILYTSVDVCILYTSVHVCILYTSVDVCILYTSLHVCILYTSIGVCILYTSVDVCIGCGFTCYLSVYPVSCYSRCFVALFHAEYSLCS